MTTPKPVALPELPEPDLTLEDTHVNLGRVHVSYFCDESMEAYALSAIAMHRAEVERLREALETITSMCEMHGEFSNGVTDSTGTIDEGNVRAGEIIGAARAALKETP